MAPSLPGQAEARVQPLGMASLPPPPEKVAGSPDGASHHCGPQKPLPSSVLESGTKGTGVSEQGLCLCGANAIRAQHDTGSKFSSSMERPNQLGLFTLRKKKRNGQTGG